MHLIKTILAKYTAFFVGLLAHLGIWGVAVIALMDAIVPVIPLDPVVAGYVYKDPHRFWMYVLMGAGASAIGSLVPYWIGRAGGEIFLLKRINRKRLEDLREKHEKGEFLSLMIPCMMPPGTPMKLIILAAGVFEMRVPVFLSALFVGRILRFGILSFLVIRFGPEIVHIMSAYAKPFMPYILGGIAIAGLLFWLWKRSQKADKSPVLDNK